ncbi:protein translocase subunit SecD [Diaphorobacter sp. HDW4B]|uniref:protein translocase subunit SecD n=1 Tax=Diaphorobacter sp. HDW4B TaxID=2714925 RepID=UPI0014094306|nr:protein translocase subunit SecD [Diaphorobacter sp. HDW4B]QIL71197.1 protein translocase subunit SecD [Diaphorobacter sp. HDW4B]
MNRYPVWKYAIMVIVLLLGVLYTLPNFFGEAPAVQVSSLKATVKVDNGVRQRVEDALKAGGMQPDSVVQEGNSVFARFDSVDNQAKAKTVIEKALIPDTSDPTFIVAQNMLSRSPAWLTALHARPMYLGLDLRGGVHFMLQVDMAAAITKKVESYAGDLRSTMRDKKIRHGGISRNGDAVEVKVRDDATLTAVRNLITDSFPDLAATSSSDSEGFTLRATIKPEALRKVQEQALKQNITTLHNRINELGVAEPVIQQQGLDRIIVQLPGVQDTAKAKDILGRTATLEVRLVDESSEARSAEMGQGAVPFGSERYLDRNQIPVIVKKQVILTGENLNDAQPGFDSQTQEPTVNLTLDSKGASIFKQVTAENVGKRMAIILFEKGKGEVVTAPVIRTEIGGGRVQISGRMTTQEANDTSLLLRAGSLAAPMEIIEEYTIGPSLGEDNIKRGIHSVVWGMVAIAVFMCFYYMIFGVISTIALGVNVLLLLAILSMLQATLTLPGIAAMALAIGVAIDSNVLINERIREELRAGVAPQQAISAGYQHAWATILDSNVTTLIAGLALLAFGSGPVRGFAVVHCIGILTSMFSAVLFSRGLVNLWYGRRKKLKSVSIGQVWKPEGDTGHRSVASGRAVAEAGDSEQ